MVHLIYACTIELRINVVVFFHKMYNPDNIFILKKNPIKNILMNNFTGNFFLQEVHKITGYLKQ